MDTNEKMAFVLEALEVDEIEDISPTTVSYTHLTLPTKRIV